VAGTRRPGGRVLRITGGETPADLVAQLHEGSVSVLERSALTRRETQVIGGLADGLGTGEIGRVLGIATKSVDNHKQHAYAKLGVHSAAEAVAVVAGATR
jgi:DNA-binding CsgD family transcriptional regulator